MMKNYDESIEIYHNPNRLYIPDHHYRILCIGGSRFRKTNVLLNLIKHQRPGNDKISLYVKDLFKSKYQLPINGRVKIWMTNLNNPKSFIDYSQTIDDVCKILENYNATRKEKC